MLSTTEKLHSGFSNLFLTFNKIIDVCQIISLKEGGDGKVYLALHLVLSPSIPFDN
jgi:hypothetical protein